MEKHVGLGALGTAEQIDPVTIHPVALVAGDGRW